MFPTPSSLLSVTPLIIVSVPLGKAAQIFSYCMFSLPLLLVIFLSYYSIQGPEFYSDFFLRYITFDTLANYILITFPFPTHKLNFSRRNACKPETFVCGTPGLFFPLFAPDKLNSILIPIKFTHGR